MKNTKTKRYKNKQNIRKFSLGKPIIKSGYEQAKAVDTSPLAVNEGYKGYTKEANAIDAGVVPTYASNAITSGLTLAVLPKGIDALSKATGMAAKTAGAVTGGLMAVKGGFDLGNAISNFGNRLSDAEIAATETKSTDMRNGVAYERVDGPDYGGVMNYANAQSHANKANFVTSAGDFAAGAGTIVGSFFSNPLLGGLIGKGAGTAIAFGLDAITGWSKAAKKEYQDALNRQAMFARNTTLQNESDAATQGLRNMYNETHKAAKGKNPGEKWSTKDYTGIQTPSGPTYGAMQGLASPDEGEIDMSTGETNYNGSANPMIRDSKADVVPVGTADNDEQYFDNYIGIPGHKKDIDGIAFADKARPFFKANEMIKIASQNIDEELQKNENHKTRDDATKKYMEKRLKQKQQEYQQQYQQNSQYIQDLVMRQSEQTTGRRYSCGKTPRFWGGVIPGILSDSWRDVTGALRDMTGDLYEEPQPGYLEDYTLPNGQYIKPVTNPLEIPSISPKVTIPDRPLALDIRTPKTGDTNGTKTSWYTRLFGNSGDTPQLGLPAWAGLAQGLPYALQTQIAANRQQPYAANSYVSNANQRAALDILGRLGYDNTQDKRALLNAARQNRYNILNTGGLSQGQKAMLIQNGLNQLALGRAALNQDAYNKNAAYKQAYASEMAKYGEASAARAQQALAAQQEAFRQAVGAKQKLQEQARKNWYTIGRQALEDYNTRANAEAMHNLYDRQVAAQEAGIKAEQDRNTKQNNTNPYSSDYIKLKADLAALKNRKLSYTPIQDLFKNKLSYSYLNNPVN